MKLPTLPRLHADWAMHLIYGLAIALVVMYACMLFGMHRGGAKAVAFVVAALAGVAKEGVDYVLSKHASVVGDGAVRTVDGMDALATAVGGLVIWLA